MTSAYSPRTSAPPLCPGCGSPEYSATPEHGRGTDRNERTRTCRRSSWGPKKYAIWVRRATRTGCMLHVLQGRTRILCAPWEEDGRMAQRRHTIRERRGSGGAEAVRIWLLGGFRVSVGSRTIEASGWRLRKAANLVKLLALAPGHRPHRERVMAALWPELDEKSAANNLH